MFVGRGAERTQLVEMVRRHRLVTITGAGGVGKTRVAIEVGRSLTADVEDGVWFVDLMAARAPGDVVEQIAVSLGVRVSQGQAIDERLVEHLERRRALLVMDNCEHVVVAAASAVERLLRGCPGVRVLATSREPLVVRGEQVVALAPLPVDGPGGVGPGDAVVLFVERFQRGHDQGRRLVASRRSAGGWTVWRWRSSWRPPGPGHSVSTVCCDDSVSICSCCRAGAPAVDHHGTLQATLDWSFTALAAHEQVVFDRLGVFVGCFTLDDAIAIAAGDDVRRRRRGRRRVRAG